MKIRLSILAAIGIAALAFVPRASGEWYDSTAGTVIATNATTSTISGPVIDATKYTNLSIGVFTSGHFTGTEQDTTNTVTLGFSKSLNGVTYTGESDVSIIITNGVNNRIVEVDTSGCKSLQLISVGNVTASNATVRIDWGGRVAQ